MRTIILAGGKGSRLGALSDAIPKPMIEIGGTPVIWHIMKIYAHYGYKDFIIALGYKGTIIKDYFLNLKYYKNDFSLNLSSGEIGFTTACCEDWNITLADTGPETLKGGRIKRIEKYLEEEVNMLTYGDGVADINIDALVRFHLSHNKAVTITGVRPPSRFGELIEENGQVISFAEKPQTTRGLINGGFMVFSKKLLDYLTPEENCDFEFGALEKLASEGQVMTYVHPGFWECVDTARDIEYLNKLWNTNRASWKIWER